MSAAATPLEASEGYEAFQLEQRGIDLIPESDRKMRPMGLFWLWSGAVWNVEFLFYGVLICTFGLSFPQAILAILIGNLAYMFLGFASLPGPLAGTTAFMVSRAPFGRNGNRLPSVFNWITPVSYTHLDVYKRQMRGRPITCSVRASLGMLRRSDATRSVRRGTGAIDPSPRGR